MENNTRQLGQTGENMAIDHLVSQGYRILDRNWKNGKYEIDIIAQSEEEIVFVEVKLRTGAEIPPDRAVQWQQKLRIMRSAHVYIIQNGISKEPRFDLITIYGFGNNKRLSHVEGYFYPILMSNKVY
jgi:putative endonuclease